MHRLALAALSLAILAACQPATIELTEEQKTEIADEVNDVHVAMWDAWRAADLDRGMSFFDTSPDLGWGFAGEMRFRIDNITAWFRPMLAGVERQDITFDERRTVVLSDDVVCVMERGTYTAFDSAGATLGSSPLAATVVWTRRDGEWKIVAGHESTPAPETE